MLPNISAARFQSRITMGGAICMWRMLNLALQVPSRAYWCLLVGAIWRCKFHVEQHCLADSVGVMLWAVQVLSADSRDLPPGSGTLQNIGAARFLFRNSMGCCKSMRMYSYSCHRELGRCTLLADTVLYQSNFGAARFPSSYAMGGCFGWCKCMWGMVLAGATLGCWFF